MELIEEADGYSFYRYKPNVFKLFHGSLRNSNLRTRIRFIIALFHGYTIYFIIKNNQELGYCVVSYGGSRRYKFASKKDILIGPYYIHENHRNNGLATLIIEKVISQYECGFESAYCYIQSVNIPSIKTVERLGFSCFSKAYYSKYLRFLKLSNEGDFLI